MSREKKPFAVAMGRNAVRFGDGLDAYDVVIDADAFMVPPEAAEATASRMCEVVEQREARLRGVAQSLYRSLSAVVDQQFTGKCLVKDDPCYDADCCSEGRFRAALAEADAVLQGHGDYVPRAALVEAEAKVKALQAVTDLLDPRENMTRELVCAYLEANGLKRPEPKVVASRDAAGVVRLEGFSDTALLNEVRRRGYAEPGIARPLTPRQRECRDHSDGHHYVGGTCSCGHPWRDLVIGTGG